MSKLAPLKPTLNQVVKDSMIKTIFHQTMDILALSQDPDADQELFDKKVNEHFKFIYHYVPKIYPEVMESYTAIDQIKQDGK